MKRISKTVVMAVALIIFAMMFAACKADNTTDIIGKWEFYSIKCSGSYNSAGVDFDMNFEASIDGDTSHLNSMQLIIFNTYSSFAFDFKADGIVILSILGEEYETEYNIASKNVIEFIDDEEIEDDEIATEFMKYNASLKNGNFIMEAAIEDYSVSIVFHRANNITPPPDDDIIDELTDEEIAAEIIGTWSFYSLTMEVGGYEILSFNIDNMTEEEEAMYSTFTTFVIEFRADGTATSSFLGESEEEEYEIEDGKIYSLDTQGEREEEGAFTYLNGRLAMEEEFEDTKIKITFQRETAE